MNIVWFKLEWWWKIYNFNDFLNNYGVIGYEKELVIKEHKKNLQTFVLCNNIFFILLFFIQI